MRYLGLDVGNRRIGVAVGNSELRIATPLGVIERKTLEEDAARVREFVHAYEVEALVVGLPRNADGSESDQARATRAYIEQLRERINLPVHFQDERYSTATALAQQHARGISEKRGRVMLDAEAAAVILQDFLDRVETGD